MGKGLAITWHSLHSGCLPHKAGRQKPWVLCWLTLGDLSALSEHNVIFRQNLSDCPCACSGQVLEDTGGQVPRTYHPRYFRKTPQRGVDATSNVTLGCSLFLHATSSSAHQL